MSIIEHGKWTLYTPREPYYKFKDARGILYVKRESDDMDWYEYIYGPPIKEEEDTSDLGERSAAIKKKEAVVEFDPPFETGSVRMIAHNFTGLWVVGAATF